MKLRGLPSYRNAWQVRHITCRLRPSVLCRNPIGGTNKQRYISGRIEYLGGMSGIVGPSKLAGN
jgi:hypothetical protein